MHRLPRQLRYRTAQRRRHSHHRPPPTAHHHPTTATTTTVVVSVVTVDRGAAGLDKEGIFRISGDALEIEAYKQAFDSNVVP
jgi:hypothetical protein